MSVPYMLATPLWGWLADTKLLPELISPAGNFLIFCSFLLIGPASYIPIDPNLFLTEIGLGFLGVGTAATLTGTFALAQKQSLRTANCTAEEAQSVVSGIWTSAFTFGSFLGPTIGGYLVDWLGFTGTTAVLQVWSAVMLIMDVFLLCCNFCGQREVGQKKVDQKERDLYQRLE